MRCSILFLFTLILVPSPATASDKIVKDSIISQNKKRSFYLFAPESLKSGTPAPLIVSKHKLSEDPQYEQYRWNEK
jgi:poly(3-hydroxybutyrate) depolymerase